MPKVQAAAAERMATHGPGRTRPPSASGGWNSPPPRRPTTIPSTIPSGARVRRDPLHGHPDAWDRRTPDACGRWSRPTSSTNGRAGCDDFDRNGWHNRMSRSASPRRVRGPQAHRRRDDRPVVVKIDARLKDFVIDPFGQHLKRTDSLARRPGFASSGRSVPRRPLDAGSIEQDREGQHRSRTRSWPAPGPTRRGCATRRWSRPRSPTPCPRASDRRGRRPVLRGRRPRRRDGPQPRRRPLRPRRARGHGSPGDRRLGTGRRWRRHGGSRRSPPAARRTAPVRRRQYPPHPGRRPRPTGRPDPDRRPRCGRGTGDDDGGGRPHRPALHREPRHDRSGGGSRSKATTSGTTIQPTRQPVMQKYFENELMMTARSENFAAVSAGNA